jgi:hypothetical protein
VIRIRSDEEEGTPWEISWSVHQEICLFSLKLGEERIMGILSEPEIEEGTVEGATEILVSGLGIEDGRERRVVVKIISEAA